MRSRCANYRTTLLLISNCGVPAARRIINSINEIKIWAIGSTQRAFHSLIRRKFVLLVVCWKNAHSVARRFREREKKRRCGFILCARAVREPQTRFAVAINNFVISLAAGPPIRCVFCKLYVGGAFFTRTCALM